MNDRELIAVISKMAKDALWTPTQLNVLQPGLTYPSIVQALDTQFQKACRRNDLELPRLTANTDTIFIASDYGGESSDSLFLTYSFVVVALDAMGMFINAQEELRREFKLKDPFKEIAFKHLSHGPTKRALDRYLTVLSNLLPGIVVTIIVETAIPTLWGKTRHDARANLIRTLEQAGLNNWKGKVAEKMLSIVHVVAYLTGLLSRGGQKVFWMTDNDAIAANARQVEQLGLVFKNILPFYTANLHPIIGYAIPFPERHALTLDVLSCADLVAGAIEHFYSRQAKMGANLSISEGAEKITRWLSYQGLMLKKFTIAIEQQGEGFVVRTVKFHEKNPSNHPTIIVPTD